VVEPLHPELREALKRANAELTDADINRVEELVALRSMLDPERDAEQLQSLETELEQLLREKMPRFQEAAQAFKALRSMQVRSTSAEPKFTVEVKEQEE
jgi:hypothetical protein